MKKVLITGENSYIGSSIEQHLTNLPNQLEVTTISVRDDEWKGQDFSKYDTVIHLAAVVHRKKISLEEYEKTNVHLTVEIASKAKKEGVKKFIFMSTMAVYGDSIEEIKKGTPENPSSYYGQTKLRAEKKILQLNDKDFHIIIIRPPMVYGEGSPGNYKKISNLAKYSPIFFDTRNSRSMIYIENLTKLFEIIIFEDIVGVIEPQNTEYVNTFDLYKVIRTMHNKKTLRIPLAFGTHQINIKLHIFKKVFGTLKYTDNLNYKLLNKINIIDFEESIKRTELGRYQ